MSAVKSRGTVQKARRTEASGPSRHGEAEGAAPNFAKNYPAYSRSIGGGMMHNYPGGVAYADDDREETG